jgi:hypothetical protein
MLSSRGEIRIHRILEANEVNFVEEYEFPDLVSTNLKPLRFDFAIFDDDGRIDFLIEYQGKQHYQAVSKFGGTKGLYQQKYNDEKKRLYCAEHNIKLIEIPYWEEERVNYDYIFKKAGY